MKEKIIPFDILTIEEVKHLLKLSQSEIREWTSFKNLCERKLKSVKDVKKK